MPQIVSVSVYVHDIELAKRFYVGALGFTQEESMGDYGFKLSHEGAAFVVLSGGKKSDPAYPGGVVLGIPTEDAEAEARLLRKAGVTFVVETPEPFPLGRFIAVSDPSGNVIELLEFSEH